MEVPPVEQYKYSTTNTQKEKYNSNTRKASPKNDQTDEVGEASPQSPESAQPPEHPLQSNSEEASPQTGAEPSSPTKPLNRLYLHQARTSTTAKPPPATGMTAIGNFLPRPNPRPTATEEWQVLVDLLSDIAREFRDEAQLSESVSRAYHLMQHAKITDIGVFTAKIYEARAITKSRYATIKRRMPYFFACLSDVCGLKPTSSAQSSPSGQ
jgi:hypothetical protein